MSFTSYMSQALEEARAAAARGEVPVGAVIVAPDGQVVAQAGNQVRQRLVTRCAHPTDGFGRIAPHPPVLVAQAAPQRRQAVRWSPYIRQCRWQTCG